MQLFYSKVVKNVEQVFELEEQENIHLTKVLRKEIGDSIYITNGNGKMFIAKILSISKKKSILKITEPIFRYNNDYKLSIAIAPTKNISRTEFFIEKVVEIGVKDIILFVSQNSERRNIKNERLNQKSLSAMKQSLKTNFTPINNLIKFEEMLMVLSETYKNKFLAYVEEKSSFFVNEIDVNFETVIIIGPEGGFTKEEVKLAKQNNFKIVSFGSSRLRTETAGIYACSIFNSLRYKK